MSWIDDLRGQVLYNAGTIVAPTVRSWNFIGFTVTYNAATRRIDIDAGGYARHGIGLAGRQSSSSDTFTTVGAFPLPLGDVAHGLPVAGLSLELQALLMTSDASVGATLDFYCHNTSQVVGSALTSVQATGPEYVTLDVTDQVGASLLADTINIISVRLKQTTLDAAERAYCDFANISTDY